MSSTHESEIIFLGLCDSVNHDVNIGKWNILGLGYVVFSYIFPLDLAGMYLGINISAKFITQQHKIQITNDSGKEVRTITLSGEAVEAPVAEDKFLKQHGQLITVSKIGRVNFFIPLNNLGLVIQEPGPYYLKLITESDVKDIGSFQSVFAKLHPLTSERKTAIKSDPNATKAVRIELGCKYCSSKHRSYAALERNDNQQDGWGWYEDAPDDFTCECGKTTINLQYIRSNLHALLGQKTSNNQNLNFLPMYEKSALKILRSNFMQLLNSTPKEELLQDFFEENPILLHQFPAERTIPKAKILSKHVADFAILTAQKELILIEIEKTTTPLMKKNGHRASALVHAFDQVKDWLCVIEEQRIAVLDCLKIDRHDVSNIRGVVIAGREKGYDAQNLRCLKMSNEGPINFLTYDDLLFALDALINKFENIG